MRETEERRRERNGFPLIELFHNKVTRLATSTPAHPAGASGATQRKNHCKTMQKDKKLTIKIILEPYVLYAFTPF